MHYHLDYSMTCIFPVLVVLGMCPIRVWSLLELFQTVYLCSSLSPHHPRLFVNSTVSNSFSSGFLLSPASFRFFWPWVCIQSTSAQVKSLSRTAHVCPSFSLLCLSYFINFTMSGPFLPVFFISCTHLILLASKKCPICIWSFWSLSITIYMCPSFLMPHPKLFINFTMSGPFLSGFLHILHSSGSVMFQYASGLLPLKLRVLPLLYICICVFSFLVWVFCFRPVFFSVHYPSGAVCFYFHPVQCFLSYTILFLL